MKGLNNGIGPNKLGSAAKMMKKSPMEIKMEKTPMEMKKATVAALKEPITEVALKG